MSANAWIRQIHRWVSVAFVLVVALIFGLLGVGREPPQWLYLVPLAPLAGLALTGIWLFVLPYLGRTRRT